MNVKETQEVIKLITNIYGPYKQDVGGVINAWSLLFVDDEFEDVHTAVLEYANDPEHHFAPLPADVRGILFRHAHGAFPSEDDVWKRIYQAICNSGGDGLDRARKQYELLPDPFKRLVSPSLLHEYAIMDVDTVTSVIRSNMMKSWRQVSEELKKEAVLTPTLRNEIAQLQDRTKNQIEPVIRPLIEPREEVVLTEHLKGKLAEFLEKKAV